MKKNKLLLFGGIFIAGVVILLLIWLSAPKTKPGSRTEPGSEKTKPGQINDNVFTLDEIIFKSGKTNAVNLGAFTTQGDKNVKMANHAPEAMTIEEWRSTCDCLEISGMPEKLEPGKTATIKVTVYPDGYWGEISKSIPLLILYGKKKRTLFMTLKFTAETDSAPAPEKKEKFVGIKIIPYSGGKIDDKRYAGAEAWLLGGKNCESCNWVKEMALPGLLKPQSSCVRVCTDEEEGLRLLLDLEKRLNIREPGEAPVLYFDGRIYYGTEAIKELLKEHIQKRRQFAEK
jgi:hypothetical protein